MTDQNPVPTTRLPVPNEPIGNESAQRETSRAAASDSAAATANDTDRTAAPPPPSDTFGAPPVPPVPPLQARPRRDDRDAGRTASVLFGLVILGLGLWFFAEHTLGYQLPRISWSQIWPVTLIVIGLWVVLGSMRRGSR